MEADFQAKLEERLTDVSKECSDDQWEPPEICSAGGYSLKVG